MSTTTSIIVTKNDGSEQRFSQTKIKLAVAKAAKRTGIPKEFSDYIQKNVPREIEKDLKGKKEVDSSEIRGLVLENLKQKSALLQEIVKEFRDYGK